MRWPKPRPIPGDLHLQRLGREAVGQALGGAGGDGDEDVHLGPEVDEVARLYEGLAEGEVALVVEVAHHEDGKPETPFSTVKPFCVRMFET